MICKECKRDTIMWTEDAVLCDECALTCLQLHGVKE